ncbi:MAG: sensor histidine kinase [Erysipelotrichaceae bacterium]|nr:sensor histidine kinase [Erysipelotrichaceae bacterium]MDD3809697.1 sensor histidine kinase [Erysipelotrichaceae bacterium]
MKLIKYVNLRNIKYLMLIVNFIVITYMAWIILSTTNYVVANSLATVFLRNLEYLPHRPEVVYFATTILYLCLFCIIIYFENQKMNLNQAIVTIIGELIIYFLIGYFIYFGYTGLILVIFVDFISKINKNHSIPSFLVIMFIISTFSRYNMISTLVKIPSFTSYVEFNPGASVNSINFIMSIFDGINFLLFIIYLLAFITHQIQENEQISNELVMINSVNEQLKVYATLTEKIGENNERKRLARELHDTLGHALTGISAGIDACITLIDVDVGATKKQLETLSKVVRVGIGDVRNSLLKLRPDALKQSSLKEALAKVCENFQEASQIKIALDYNLPDLDLDNLREDAIFRTIQEGITNSKRHGQASEVNISVNKIENEIVIIIKDNGFGCKKVQEGYGIKQMKERIQALNGSVFLDGNDGFCLSVTLKI